MLSTNKIFFPILCIVLFFSTTNQAWSQSIEKQTVLAALTINVARFTTWPELIFKEPESAFNLCVYGDNVVQQSFSNINNKQVNKRSIHIINISRLRKLNQCQLIYISELERNKLIPLLLELKDKPILTIGENIEFLQAGGIVGLENINGKIQLTINLAIIKQSKLVISSRLLKLATIVNYPMLNN